MSDQDVIKGLSIFFGVTTCLLGGFSLIVCVGSLITLVSDGDVKVWVLWSALLASYLSFLSGWVSCKLDDQRAYN